MHTSHIADVVDHCQGFLLQFAPGLSKAKNWTVHCRQHENILFIFPATNYRRTRAAVVDCACVQVPFAQLSLHASPGFFSLSHTPWFPWQQDHDTVWGSNNNCPHTSGSLCPADTASAARQQHSLLLRCLLTQNISK